MTLLTCVAFANFSLALQGCLCLVEKLICLFGGRIYTCHWFSLCSFLVLLYKWWMFSVQKCWCYFPALVCVRVSFVKCSTANDLEVETNQSSFFMLFDLTPVYWGLCSSFISILNNLSWMMKKNKYKWTLRILGQTMTEEIFLQAYPICEQFGSLILLSWPFSWYIGIILSFPCSSKTTLLAEMRQIDLFCYTK